MVMAHEGHFLALKLSVKHIFSSKLKYPFLPYLIAIGTELFHNLSNEATLLLR